MSKQPLIAIVDDDEAMREALGDLLQVAGYAGRTYPSAADFLDDYAPGRFDLVITDLRMPHIDGVELLRRLNASSAAPPALVITSSSDASTRERAIDNGAIECLTKPVEDDILLHLLSSALAGKRNCGPDQ